MLLTELGGNPELDAIVVAEVGLGKGKVSYTVVVELVLVRSVTVVLL